VATAALGLSVERSSTEGFAGEGARAT